MNAMTGNEGRLAGHLLLIKKTLKQHTVAQPETLALRGVCVGRLGIPGQPQPHGKFEASIVYLRPYFKKEKKKKHDPDNPCKTPLGRLW